MKEGQPYGCPSLLLDQTLDQNDQNDDGQDELEVDLEPGGHPQAGALLLPPDTCQSPSPTC